MLSFKFRILSLLVFTSSFVFGQKINGVVYEVQELKKEVPLFGTSILWEGTNVGTYSKEDGSFELERVESTSKLIFRYVGKKADTVIVAPNTKSLKVTLKQGGELEEILIKVEQSSSFLDYMETRHVEIISEKELQKAACCNLSESFETNPSVDVSFADAVTGTRQIQMLGLAGKYSLITREVMPNVRGLISNYGLSYIPGTWIQSIQVTKGIGSVANGYESITGQINVELKKPYDGDAEEEKLYANVYGNMMGRTEVNFNYGMKISDKFSNTTLLHASTRPFKIDNNGDGFLDVPVGHHLNMVHRWKYFGGNGHMAQIGINVLADKKQGGQMGFNPDRDKLDTNYYGLGIDSKRFEVWGKTGYVFGDPCLKQSIGFQTSSSLYLNKSYFGLTNYSSEQNTIYNNLMYQKGFEGKNHLLKTGISFIYDWTEEYFLSQEALTYSRMELVPGAFTEFTYAPAESFNMVLGARADYHNIIGFMFNPRLHAKYHPTENTTIRLTSGKGLRIANIFAENMAVFASSRTIVFDNAKGDSRLYGLKPEEAWNNGVSIAQDFKINYHKGSIVFDFYRTDFINQVITDLYQNQYEIHFYNLDGKSFSNSAQLEVKYSPFKRFDVKTAYRFYDVKATFDTELVNVPFIAQQRAFINFSYETRNNWMFDATTLWTGKQTIPVKTGMNPTFAPVSSLVGNSPDFITINAQISKSWNDGKFNVYVGSENLTNFRQANPIFAADNPFGRDFDAALVWGPIFGRNIYGGIKFKI